MPVDHKWNHVKEVLNTTCAEVLGKKMFQEKDWISVNTVNKVQKRKTVKQVQNISKTQAAKSKAQLWYTEIHKEVKHSIRSAKRNYIKQLATEAEEATSKGNLNEHCQLHVYKITKTLFGKQRQVTTPIKIRRERFLPNEYRRPVERWAEYFKELLHLNTCRPAPSTTPEIFPAKVDLDISCERPNKQEIRRAIKHLKNGKLSCQT